jgi:HD-GYP domain-containing protein (c-di-GMP phosphodiesterase class II)
MSQIRKIFRSAAGGPPQDSRSDSSMESGSSILIKDTPLSIRGECGKRDVSGQCVGVMAGQTVPLSIDELRVGVTCSHPVEGDHGVLLLGSNTRINQQVITGLRDRGIRSIEVDPRDLAAMRGGTTAKRRTVTSARDRGGADQWIRSKPVKDLLVDRHEEALSVERTKRLEGAMSHAKKRMETLRESVASQTIRSVSQLVEVSDGYARSIVDDHDQTVGVVGKNIESDDLSERSVRLSTLGMAVAIEMGLDGLQMMEIGISGLLHDIGLYAMDPMFVQCERQLTAAEWWEYKKHPNVSADCVSDAIDVSESVQLTIEQVHEQQDGSGYPRGVKGQRIHMNARILNVVDVYLRLTTTSSHRSGIVPHDAMGLILHLASRGLFDPQVIRAFLSIETLFPLGSSVELSSGQHAQVVRRPRAGFAAPVLYSDDGDRIEMESTNLEIVRPLCDQEAGQVRMMRDDMLDSTWHPASPDSIA